MRHCAGVAIIVGVFAQIAFAGIIHVPADSPTIQIAISQAQPFDTIIVAPGTYFEAISFGGKVITVQSSNPTNPATVAATIINAGGLGSVVTFNGGEDQVNTILDGFTITGGTIGVNGNDSRAVVRRCVIRDNTSFGLRQVDGLIEDCKIINNMSYGLNDCDGTKRRTLVSQNRTVGAASCDGTFEDCIIERTGPGGGQGDGVDGGTASYLRTVIARNGRSGILSHTNGRISGSYIIGNTENGVWFGGGVIENSVIAGNRHHGILNSQKNVSSCTVTGNGFFGFGNHSGTIRHCIIWDNASGALTGSTTPLFSGTTNPFFLNPGFYDTLGMVWIDGDYHLTPNSPYIDAGDPFYLMDPTAPLIDITGSPRVVGARIDIGAFEFQADCVGEDFDSDGTADICDPDIDGDGITNVTDVCDDTPSGLTVDFEGRPTADLNHDCSVDLADFAIFQTDLVGP